MSATIEVNKKSVKDLLTTGAKNLFVIPEYQRPYAWDEDEVQTLFDDLWDFTMQGDEKGTYFLGSIVSFLNDNGEQEIIDGQQRITSLFLLLRAIYEMLDKVDPKTPEANNFIRQIVPALWKTDEMTGDADTSSVLLKSRVVNDEENDILRKILETGKTNKQANDKYSKNYTKFVELLENASQKDPTRIYHFIKDILNNAILLPIQANEMDTALTIFSTLNNRGLQLSDADIFKANIYKKLNLNERNEFISTWQTLVENAEYAGESIQKLFYYYMFYLRALNNDSKSTTPGLRKFFMENNRLQNDELMSNLGKIAQLWKVINKHEDIENESWSKNTDILKALDILASYPNEYWKYPVIIFYISHIEEMNFEENFKLFLNKLVRELLIKYLIKPTINAIKTDIMKLNIACLNSAHPKFDFSEIDLTDLDNKIKVPHKNAVRMLLKILAYDEQNELLPTSWEIEHIFPQKYQNTYFIGKSDDEILERMEHLGNKTPFEKKLNIIAGNGYFSKKQQEYAKSTIKITFDLSKLKNGDWNLDDIMVRDVRIADRIEKIIEDWNNEYLKINNSFNDVVQPTEEDLKKIKEYKEKGWI